MAGALAAWGLRLILIRDDAVEVDLDKRTYVLTRDGRPSAARALDELGPLVTYARGRNGRRGNEYAVKSSAVSDLAFFVAGTPEKARRQMEDLARRWRLSCQSIDGTVRAAQDLDKPLHERLRGSAPEEPASLRPEWNLRIDELRPGYALVSTNRSFAPFAEGASIFVGLLGALGLGSVVALPSTVRDTVRERGDEFGKVLLGLAGVVLVVVVFQIGRALRDALLPGALRVTPDGVSYRGRRLAFDEIEEVTSSVPLEILGDRRKLRLSASFCPAEARGAAVAEIQRLILAVAPHAPRPG